MAGRPTRAEELGLIEEIQQEEDGHYRAILTEPDGTIVFDKGNYKSEVVAHKGAGYWIRQHYRAHRRSKLSQAPSPSSSSQSGQLLSLMRTRATDNETQAQRLRAQADLLEAEAKKLHAAADILEGPPE